MANPIRGITPFHSLFSKSMIPSRKFFSFLLACILSISGCSTLTTSSNDNHWTLTPDQKTWVETELRRLTVEQKIGQLIVTGFEGSVLDESTCQMLQRIHPGGVTFQSQNVLNPDQMKELTQRVKDCVVNGDSPSPLLTISQEGEYVSQFKDKATVFPAALAIGATGKPDMAYDLAKASGEELAYSGLNTVFAPVADVLTNLDNEVISQRAFGGDPDQVCAFVTQSVKGYQQAGIITTLKHFPGHGGVADDSHVVAPQDPITQALLEKDYLPPFRCGLEAGAEIVMLNHIAYPEITGNDLPASLSTKVVSMLRNNLYFQGIILSDSMRMKAVSGKQRSIPRASLDAIVAGEDMALLNDSLQAEATYDFLLDAYREKKLPMTRIDQAVQKILTVKALAGINAAASEANPEPDWQGHAKLATQASELAVTLFRDQDGLLPIQSGQKILFIGPQPEWDFYRPLADIMAQHGIQAEFVYFPPPWDGPVQDSRLLEALPGVATGYDRVILFTWQAYLNSITQDDPWQIQLVERMQQAGVNPIIVALKSPTDLLAYRDVPAFLATFGTRAGTIEQLANIILGLAAPSGKNPLPGLNP